MILYPTETVYGLGVNPFERSEVKRLYDLKQRDYDKPVSWLVRNVEDIAHYAELSDKAREVADEYLPGPLTLVLPSKDSDELLSFRISSDPVAQKVIAEFMAEYDAPLTCTSANVSSQPTLETPKEIIDQLGVDADRLEIVDDGPRLGQPSTVAKVVGDNLEIIRDGAVELESNI